MDRTKCSNCGLVNFASDGTCRRCSGTLAVNAPGRTSDSRGHKPQGLSRFPFILLVLIAGIIVYFVYGTRDSLNVVTEKDQRRVATQANQPAAELLPRKEADEHRAQQYKNAIANSPALAERRKHEQEVEKALQP